MKYFKSTTIVFALLSIIFSCKKSADTTPANTTLAPTTGTLYFHLHTDVDTNEVANYGDIYVLTGGRKISVSKAQLYISNIQLVRADSSVYTVPNTVLLKVQEIEPYLVGNVPAGNYVTVRFTVGLDSSTNAKVPTSSDTTFNNSSMWFGGSAQPSGYVFVNFQGTIDTTLAGNSNKLIPFMYMIGTTANKRLVTMPYQGFTITSGQAQYIHMIIDYNKLLTGVNLSNGNNLMVMSPTGNNSTIATTISNNIPTIFQYE
jgi:hypothetical protein